MLNTCTAFAGSRRVASGDLATVALEVKRAADAGEPASILVFDDGTSQPVELDLRGTPDDVVQRYATPSGEEPRRPGRPKLGVVAREVTLLPRHWDWLNSQPGGASVALRKLLEDARRVNAEKDRIRLAREAAYRFFSAMAGNEPGFEEAARALFAGNEPRFQEMSALWPPDIRDHARRLAAPAFHPGGTIEK